MPGTMSEPRKENRMPAKDLLQFRWFVDPVPDWIFKDPRWQETLQTAVDLRTSEIDLQIKELTLEKARILKMLPQTAGKITQVAARK
jgi:hypothetical protein